MSGCNDTASEMIYPLLPAFIVTTLGGSAALLGALDGASDLTASLLRLVSGRLADARRRRKRLVFGGYALAVAVRPLMALARSAGLVIGLRVVDRVGKGLRSPARDAMVADAVVAEQRGRAFGFQRAFDHGGAVLGSLIAWAMLEFGGAGPRTVIWWSIVPGILALVVLGATLRITAMPAATAARHAVASAEPAQIFWFPILSLTLLISVRLPETLLLLHLERGGVALAMVPLAWAGLNLARSATAYPAGWLVDRIGERGVVVLSGVVGAAMAYAFSRAATTVALVGVFLLLGTASAISEPAERTLVARLAPKGVGRAYGQAQAVQGFAALAAGLGYGALVDLRGTAFALATSALAAVSATLIWLLVPRRG